MASAPMPREAHLALRVVGIDEVDVERDLAVDADGLNLLDERRAGPLEHLFPPSLHEDVDGIRSRIDEREPDAAVFRLR